MDGDGRDDVITGHYWPGDIFLFRGQEGGGFAAMENLKDETGRNLNAGEPWVSEDEPRMESLAAAPYAVDWDRDGDYDMLIGNISGGVILMKNVGGPKEPKFSTERVELVADGKPIRVPGGDAGPVVADWDRDGKRDLISGAGDGSVWFYRNVGADDAPSFAAGRTLVAASEGGFTPFAHGGAPEGPGVRSKVCVTDFDGDGREDLLLGDYCTEEAAPLDLTDEQIARRDELKQQRTALLEEMNDIGEDEEALEAWSKRYQELYSELSELEPQTLSHGFVWLFKRLPGERTAQADR